jgi:hypothetical protein
MDIEDGKARLPAITQQVAPHASSPNRDDRCRDGKRVEPAMEVLPLVGLQRMPERASPGRPPVDPEVEDIRPDENPRPLAGKRPAARRREGAGRRVVGRGTGPCGRRHWMDARYRTTHWRGSGA